MSNLVEFRPASGSEAVGGSLLGNEGASSNGSAPNNEGVSDKESQLGNEVETLLPTRNLVSLFFGLRGSTTMLAICAEPGFGQEGVISDLMAEAGRRGYRALRYDFRFKGSEAASAEIVRVARRASRMEQPVVAAFDSIPPSDESCVRRQARALRRMWEAGVPVVFSLAPEGSQLLELLPECTIVRTHDLLLGFTAGSDAGDRLRTLRSLSWGIPSLSRILLPELGSNGELATIPSSYFEELGSLVTGSLRPSLSDEELRLRLAMHLLGRGTCEELALVCGGVSRELLEWIRDTAPVFAISSRLDRFRSLTDARTGALESCLSALSPTSSMFETVCPACIELLFGRGDVERAACLFSLPHAEIALPAALSHAVPLLDVGRVDILQRALEDESCEGELESEPEYAGALRRAVCALAGDVRDATPSAFGTAWAHALEGPSRDLALFCDLRWMLRGEAPVPLLDEAGLTDAGRRLLVHREARNLMVRGRFSAATRLLVANPADGAATQVSSALLCLDLEVSRLLLGDSPTEESGEVEAALRLLSSERVPGLRGYANCLRLVRAVLTGGTDASGIAGQLISRSERSGDALVQLVALLVGCVTDIRSGAIARGNVRATLALTLARGLSLDYLARLADLLGRAARHLLGEPVPARDERDFGDDLEEVCLLADEVMLAEEDAAVVRRASGDRAPREALWVLLVLTEGMGALSLELREALPSEWARALAAMRGRVLRPGRGTAWLGEGAAGGQTSGRDGEGRGVPPVDLRLLGGFELRVDGVRVLDGRLEHRSAKPLMEYLALRQGATAKRFELVEQVWPECDYASGFGRIYQATSVIRSVIGGVRKGLDPFVVGRSSKEVSLNRTLVRCDVDDFRLCAREAIDGTGDERVLEMARKAEGLYAGDLYLPSVDATGFIYETREELRLLYADAMVAGAEAALRLGKGRTSIRLASNALATDDMREDAVTALVRALKASGRNAEAEQQYRKYAGKLLRTSRRAPSKQLRREAGDVLGQAGEATVSEAMVE